MGLVRHRASLLTLLGCSGVFGVSFGWDIFRFGPNLGRLMPNLFSKYPKRDKILAYRSRMECHHNCRPKSTFYHPACYYLLRSNRHCCESSRQYRRLQQPPPTTTAPGQRQMCQLSADYAHLPQRPEETRTAGRAEDYRTSRQRLHEQRTLF